ncbi:poly(U)-specific endoribonuclease-like [Alligator mississippiensis]|uniref:Uridylate-specific endoribonuclease n=1 Tax=Alligator mississippiensis TaxID=8496 RepID=A0A151M664_ALLMI|nr:poly(U)-specific endoribonuclease-like [Alligator mississippiensis]
MADPGVAVTCSWVSGAAEAEEDAEHESTGLYTAPDSCKRRCHERFNKRDPCHCNTKCEKYQNCCEDYHTYCSQDGKQEDNEAVHAHSSGE